MNASHLLWRYASVVVDVVVVVLPVAGAAVVGRVDVDAVDLAGVGEPQRLERVVVLAVDDDVVRLVAAALDRAEVPEAGQDRLAEVGDHHERVERRRSRSPTGCSPRCDVGAVGVADQLERRDAVLDQRRPRTSGCRRHRG